MKPQSFILTIGCLLLSVFCQAQITFRFSDLFKQNKKERNNTILSIAELQIYLTALRQGYQLVNDGLQTVRAIRKGEFDLHDLYYLSKKKVSGAVKRYPAALQTLQQSQFVQQQLQRFLRQVNHDTVLTDQQRTFLKQTAAAVVTDVDNLTGELQVLLTDDKLELSDAERIRRIEDALERSHRQVAFTKTFCTDARFLVTAKTAEAIELGVLQGYYNIPKK